MPQRLSGIWFKLVEGDGFYLGILMVPEDVARALESPGRTRCARMPTMAIGLWTGTNAAPVAEIQTIDFVLADNLMRDAIMVFGITLSDLNKERGFAFIPSAEYLLRGPTKAQVNAGKVNDKAVSNRFAALDFT
jgi:hypothetical protein